MKHFKLPFIWATVSSMILLNAVTAAGQCTGATIKLEHTAGTVTVGCGTAVTVTSDGFASTILQGPCLYGPYRIGYSNMPGSYTFTFSTPVQGVVLDVQFLDNFPNSPAEEMVIDVDGAFFPLTSPGMPDGCNEPTFISPPGTLRAPLGYVGSAKNIIIPGPINSIKVADVVLLGAPHGFAFNISICCQPCTTNAGTINSNGINACINEAVAIPSSLSVLEADDLLQYILFTDSGNPLVSILATSSTPSFSFNPGNMVIGETYYVAAIVGNDLNGTVDSSDPCWDISNIVPLVWWSPPTVVLSSENVDCLQPGECYDINLSFIGVPPFHLTAQVFSGGSVISIIDSTYNLPSAVMMLCLPSTTPTGVITLEALSLSDNYCSCN